MQAYPTAADCDSSQAATDYLRAKQYFNQDGGLIVSDSNVDITALPTERAVAQAQQLERFFGDYPGLKGKFDGIKYH
ncbi:MAG: hypothetical protein MJ163_03310, partial [Alphaproteobacteria bacterium]|nr:hypothetical protein [Alphaproteobacteria bacterium]